MTGWTLGTATVDITPPWPVPLAGFATRRGRAQGVASRLSAKIFALTGTGDRHRLVLVCADLLWWGHDLVGVLHKEVRERHGCDVHLVLHASHTHSGPQTADDMLASLGPLDQRYNEWLITALLPAIGIALERPREVVIERYRGRCDIAMCRRGIDPASGRVAAAPKPCRQHEVDHELTLLVFQGDRRPTAALLHYACHPVIHAGNAVSADFPGPATGALERWLGGDAVVGYLQGFAGDVNPASIDAEEFVFGSQVDVDRFGHRLAEAAKAALSTAPVVIEPEPIEVRRVAVPLPLARRPGMYELQQAARSSDVEGEWARRLLQRGGTDTDHVTLALTFVDLGPRLALLGTNMEPVGFYGRLVKRLSQGTVLPIGYTDGMVGYLVTAEQLDEGGYEPDVSTRYFGWPARLAARAPAAAEAAIARLLDRGIT